MIILERFAYTPVGTFGVLRFGDFQCYTVERPWLNNQPRVSCIPEGNYNLVWFNGPRFGRTVAFDGGVVSPLPRPGAVRSSVLIHAGNTMDDFEGCVGLGSTLGFVNNKWAVVNSVPTVKKFYSLLPTDQTSYPIVITQIQGAI